MMFSKSLIPLALQIALLATSSSAVLVVDWSSYPAGAVNCLNAAQASAKCPSTDVPSFNGCVCKNGNGFLQSAATCLGTSDAGDVAGVYNQLSSNCAGTGIPVNIALAQWDSWASPAAPAGTTTPPAAVTTPPAGTVVVTQPQSTAVVTLTAGNSATVVSTVVQSSGGVAKTTVITVNPGQSTTIPNILTVQGSSSTGTPASSSSSSGSKLGVGAIAGIAVGGAVVIAIIGLIAVLLLRRGGNRNNQPATSQPAFAAAAVPPAPPMSDAGMGPSPGMAQAEPYKDRPVSSIPSTAASPDPTKGGSAFNTPQGPYAVPSPQMQQYGNMQPGYQYPPGQYPQDPSMQGYAQQQYAGTPQQYPGSPYQQGQMPYGAQPPQPYVPHPGQQFSELHSESAEASQRVELPGGPGYQ